ncbi:MAG: type I-B CRISPR-associated endonuclease Cas1b [Ignavibacteria bacterium]|nr:type I-B CRISPR-associated endonuclease Cas1b [Ignavibacteria bacterium]
MKQNLYIFSNSVLRKKDNTLLVESRPDSQPACEADIDTQEQDVIIPSPADDGYTAKKYIPADNIEAIFTFGDVKFNSRLLSLAAHYGILIHSFNYYGKYIGSFLPISSINSGNIVIQQVNAYNDYSKRLKIAISFVKGATLNALSNLLYYKYRNVDFDEEINKINLLINSLDSAISTGELMGIEGNIKSIYYGSWKKIFKKEIEFTKRVKRPPDNMINSLISYGNAVLYGVCLNEIYRTGLLPSIGYLHSPGENRLPLSFDLAEIFKPVIVDKTIFKIVNKDLLSDSDFYIRNGVYTMKDKFKKLFIENLETRLKATIIHEQLKRSISYRTIIRLECHKLISFLKGNDDYIPYYNKP